MLQGLLDGGWRSDPPFREMFPWQPIHIFVGRREGVTLHMPQGEGGEQGDPLMPILFALGQHGALEATQASLGRGDIYTVSKPDAVDEELLTNAQIHLHHGKTQG